MLPAAEDAEEVYQDVFVKVFKNIRTYNEQKSSLKTWISRIAYNEAVTWLRHKHPAMIYFEDREGSAEKLSDADVEETLGHANSETVQLIRAALKHLPPEERAIITPATQAAAIQGQMMRRGFFCSFTTRCISRSLRSAGIRGRSASSMLRASRRFLSAFRSAFNSSVMIATF